MPGGVRTEVHLGAKDTGGAFCLLIDEPPAGWSLPAHLHRGVAETIHIVSGEFWMQVGGERLRLIAGQTLHVPPDALHSGGNSGDTTGRRILIFTPGGMERFFLEAGAADPETEADRGLVAAAARRHGWEFPLGN